MSTKVNTQGIILNDTNIIDYISYYNSNYGLWSNQWSPWNVFNVENSSENALATLEFKSPVSSETFGSGWEVGGQLDTFINALSFNLDVGVAKYKLYKCHIDGICDLLESIPMSSLIIELTTSDGSYNHRKFYGVDSPSASDLNQKDLILSVRDSRTGSHTLYGFNNKSDTLDATCGFIVVRSKFSSGSVFYNNSEVRDDCFFVYSKNKIKHDYLSNHTATFDIKINSSNPDSLGNESIVGSNSEVNSNINVFKDIKDKIANMMNGSGGSKFLAYDNSPFYPLDDNNFADGSIIDHRILDGIIQVTQDMEDLRACNSCVSRCTSSCKSGCTGCKGNCNGDGCKAELVLWCTGCGKACKEYCGGGCLGGNCKSATCSNLCATGCKNSCESGCANSQRVGAFSV